MPYNRCITEEAARRQETVEQYLLDKMTRTSYCQISISDICQATGISRTAFYRYYRNKDACLCALLDRKLMESAIATLSTPSGTTEDRIRNMLNYWRREKQLLDALVSNGLVTMLVERTVYYVEREARDTMELMSTDLMDCDGDMLIFTLSGLIALITAWHQAGFPVSEEEMVAKVQRLLVQPLFTLR